ncbi:MAG: ABC transporter substrate-binding protein [Desulfobacterales bacterium]|nr:MAG: ABC transporter substrate-binding protein [Desulfobacterales bacterium]
MERSDRRAKKSLLCLITSLVALGLLFGPAAGTYKVWAAEKKELVIGGALCLTGVQAPLDMPGLRGAQVAVKELNEKGGILGRPVKFINLDGKSDPVTVGNVTVQLINQGAELVVAPCDFDFGGPASREAQKAGRVGISTCASSPLYSSKALGDKQFTLSMWNTTMGAAAAEYAYVEKGWKTAYVVTDTFIDYTTSLSEYFIKAFEMYGGKVFAEDKYTQGDQDFSAQLARIQALQEKPDVLFISSYMPDLGTIIRSIREVGINTPIMGGDSYDDSGLFDALGDKFGNDIWFVTHSWMGPEGKVGMDKFLERYQKEFGEAPDTAFVATGYDTIMVMAQAVEKAGSTDGAAVAKVMETTEFDLLTGKLKWSDAGTGHEPNKEAVLVELAQGKPAFIGWRRPEKVPPP